MLSKGGMTMNETPTLSGNGKFRIIRIIAEILFYVLAIIGAPLLFIVLSVHGFGMIFPFLFFFVIISVLVIGAVFFIWRFCKSQKRIRLLKTTIGIIIVLVPFVFIFELFTGWLRSPFVHSYISSYVAQNYEDFDLVVNRPSLHLELQTFTSQVHDRNNPDLRFCVSPNNGGFIDTFTNGGFWSKIFETMLRPLLEEEFGDELLLFTSWISGMQVGQPFDLTADNLIIGSHITIATECSDPKTLTTKIKRYHVFITENGFNFTSHSFSFVHPDYEHSIGITMSPQIINDDLSALIMYARNNRNQHGNFQSGGNFSYTSYVDFIRAGE